MGNGLSDRKAETQELMQIRQEAYEYFLFDAFLWPDYQQKFAKGLEKGSSMH